MQNKLLTYLLTLFTYLFYLLLIFLYVDVIIRRVGLFVYKYYFAVCGIIKVVCSSCQLV